jgi:putative DNA methylase
MLAWTSHDRQKLLSVESCKRFEAARQKPALFKDPVQLRGALLDFIADFANWDNSNVREYLDSSRALTQAAHEALGGASGTRPLVVDPFAGGGSIPLEALRVGADAFASDLNPVAVLLNKVVLEYIPNHGQHLADEVRKSGKWIKREAEKELSQFYPRDPDGAIPIAYLWARLIQCEGPGCGAEVPLLRSLWLAKKANRSIALRLVPNSKAKRVDFQIIVERRDGWVDQSNPESKIGHPEFDGTVKRGSATCSCCGYTTPAARVREQLKARRGGANYARLYSVVTTKPKEEGRFYRLPTDRDVRAVKRAGEELEHRKKIHRGALSLIPDEPTPIGGGSGAGRAFGQRAYGMDCFGDLFAARQLLGLTTLAGLVRNEAARVGGEVAALLALCVDRVADKCASLVFWHDSREFVDHVFARQALSMTWNFAEAPILSDVGWDGAFEWVAKACEKLALSLYSIPQKGSAVAANAVAHPLPNDAAQAFVTDPPYYDAVPYSDLADFFYVWLKRALPSSLLPGFDDKLTPKDDECIVDEVKGKDRSYFESAMQRAMAEGRRVLASDGVGIVLFAHKSTAGWEALLQAMVDAGWIVTGSWPIDTEMATRIRAKNSAALASSVHLVCRPREYPDGSVRTEEVGDWRDVLQELPRRIHEWMPRLAEEGIVGADAIFACLGPALEIFSRYSRVEKASGEAVTLKEYLEQVWAAVAKEALTMVFQGADATGFEADARLTAMWLWTLQAGDADDANVGSTEADEGNDEPESVAKKSKTGGFILEYDAARKIAQGLGAHLEDLRSLVEVSGEQARLLPVGERARYLFGKDEGRVTPQRKKREPQMDLFKVLEQADGEGMSFGETKVEHQGATVLDRIHQSMILFAAGRGEALKRFLVEDGAGRDQRFWRLAQALSALYPSHIEEKRWVDGVLARKKGLGF